VKIDIGHALFSAQEGEIDPAAKPLKGFGGAGVTLASPIPSKLEVVARRSKDRVNGFRRFSIGRRRAENLYGIG